MLRPQDRASYNKARLRMGTRADCLKQITRDQNEGAQTSNEDVPDKYSRFTSRISFVARVLLGHNPSTSEALPIWTFYDDQS